MSRLPTFESRRARVGLTLMLMGMLVALVRLEGEAQEVMTHEELMRRARGLSVVQTNLTAPPELRPVATNLPALPAAGGVAPILPAPKTTVGAPEVPLAQTKAVFTEVPVEHRPPPAAVAVGVPPKVAPLPVVARASKSKAVFSEVPEDFNESPGQSAPKAEATSTNAMATLDHVHQLAIGDRLSFRIVEDEEEPKALVVTDSGELEVPYLGRFSAAGKTCKELAFALKKELEKEYYYQATVVVAVDLMTRSRGKVYLVGPVRMPGPLEIPSDEVLTLSKAILRAGGFTDFADKKSVKVTRRNSSGSGADQNYTVNVAEVLEQGRTESDLILRPGDLIYVQERMIRF